MTTTNRDITTPPRLSKELQTLLDEDRALREEMEAHETELSRLHARQYSIKGEIAALEIPPLKAEMEANTVIANILAAQSVNVSTVSRATYSSNGILEATANALGLDFTNPNSSGTGRGGRGRH